MRPPTPRNGHETPQAEGISLASVWQMHSPADADRALADSQGAFVYRREAHPNDRSLAHKLRFLHAGHSAVLTAQGMSSIAALAITILKPGDTIWVASELYGKSMQLFRRDLARWQVTTRTFDPSSAEEIAQLRAAAPAMVLVETLSNPRVRLPDLERLVEATRSANTALVVDNTFASHLLCQPLELGADYVVESLGKIVNGHSDAMVGLVAGRDVDVMARVQGTVSAFGMASSPMDCFLTERGLASLAVRMERACQNALALANALDKLDSVRMVDYPGLDSHPQRELAARTLTGGFGWMLSFHVAPNAVDDLFAKLRPEIPFVPSLGDISTTVSHPATTSHRGSSEQERLELGIDYGTVRVSCGLEPTGWLVNRFLEALI